MATVRDIFIILWLIGAAHAAEVPEVDTEELIRQLSSDSFSAREQATAALSERAERIWERLEQLAKSTDLEISQRAKMAMYKPGKRELENAIEAARRKLLATDEELRESETKLQQKIAELSVKLDAAERKIQDADGKNEKLSEDKQKELAAARAANEDMFKQIQALKDEQEALRMNVRPIRDALQTRVIQLTHLAENGEIMKPGTIDTWSPASLPFERRLSSKLSFEFNETPLDKALAFIGEVSKVTITIDGKALKGGKDKTPVTLRVQDMETQLALKWIARIASLDIYIDADNARIDLNPLPETP